ncbi:phage tail protein [Romboutsia sp.]|uniref:phage tail protein n=2 Tax=Clostridia TaxID=186801 RepID=UPI00216BF887|nr:phage tail protein [Romboutsia sp.]MCI9062903.1 hypothetical protein [Romboutsia sp.]
MLQLRDLNNEKIEGLTKYRDLKIESTLATGDKVLSFVYPRKFSNNIIEESYIETKEDIFVIKQIDKKSDIDINVTCSLNVEELENMLETFVSVGDTIESCINSVLAGTGWGVNVESSINKKRRTIRKTNSSVWDILQEIKKTYNVEIKFDTKNKIVIVKEQLGSDKGVYFIEQLNLTSLSVESNTYDFYTKIIALGKDGLRVEVENYSYSNKKKTFIWKDERYTDEDSLREDATLKLKEMSKPYKAYSAELIDLAKINANYKDILSYELGDIVTLISKENKLKLKHRIVKITEYPNDPQKNTVEIANTVLSFEELQKEMQDTTDTVNNITLDNGTVDGNRVSSINPDSLPEFSYTPNYVYNSSFARFNKNLKPDYWNTNSIVSNAFTASGNYSLYMKAGEYCYQKGVTGAELINTSKWPELSTRFSFRALGKGTLKFSLWSGGKQLGFKLENSSDYVTEAIYEIDIDYWGATVETITLEPSLNVVEIHFDCTSGYIYLDSIMAYPLHESTKALIYQDGPMSRNDAMTIVESDLVDATVGDMWFVRKEDLK